MERRSGLTRLGGMHAQNVIRSAALASAASRVPVGTGDINDWHDDMSDDMMTGTGHEFLHQTQLVSVNADNVHYVKSR